MQSAQALAQAVKAAACSCCLFSANATLMGEPPRTRNKTASNVHAVLFMMQSPVLKLKEVALVKLAPNSLNGCQVVDLPQERIVVFLPK
jgi:hypothetical protein